MAIPKFLIQLFASFQSRKIRKMAGNAVRDQQEIFSYLISKARATSFGKDHDFDSIKDHKDFCRKVPVRGYEEIKHYIENIIQGEKDVLWPGIPRYFAKTSGTTSGVKYIPISKESIGFHIRTARNAILNYVAETKADIFSRKMIFLSGSPTLGKTGGIFTGRLSGIVNHEVPAWVRPNQLPSYKTNCVEDWEDKLELIVEETIDQDMSLISGIPPWVQMYYEQLIRKSGKSTIKELFPNLRLFIHGGVNYQPYKAILDAFHGEGVDTLETYPASEGFIAFQDDQQDNGLLLNTNAGMFYEFVEPKFINNEDPPRLTLAEVKTGVDYAIVVSSNAGLWAYNIGDTIRFTSLDPYKIRVSGRIKHFISAFGEHVISKEVEEAMDLASRKFELKVTEFTVAPHINPENEELPHHEWLVEFDRIPENLTEIESFLDSEMCRQNIYYKDLIEGQILRKLKITPLQRDAFRKYMKSQGKLGGQNKVPRLTNDRKIAEKLYDYNE
ncbi:MAG: GH3 auxin-responsive promoter family protein [Saprospiraceae bacterium]|nr:GH3 auxin-responsive promoter family protein [Saprospiraceae bacterium]